MLGCILGMREDPAVGRSVNGHSGRGGVGGSYIETKNWKMERESPELCCFSYACNDRSALRRRESQQLRPMHAPASPLSASLVPFIGSP